MTNLLESIYYNPSNPASYSTDKKLYKASKRSDPNITLEDVRHWLSGENTYTLHRPARRNFKRDRVFVRGPNEQFQADLVDMQKFSRLNKGFRYILTVIDCFSKYAFAIPVKNKSGIVVKKAFEKVFKEKKPDLLQTDRGTEFLNPTVQNYLKYLDIHYFTTFNTKFKCSIVERFNRTLKSKMFKYFTANGTRKYLIALPKIVFGYNHTIHRSTKMAPANVNDKNKNIVFYNLYGVANEREYILKYKHSDKLKSGDKVRMAYEVNPFDKGYYPNWTDVLYTIDKPIKGKYILKDAKDERLKRRYYPKEIQKVRENLYRIEKIIKRQTQNGQQGFIVKWLGYSPEHNSWVPSSAIQNARKV
jgi:transposase InsO family protein